MSDEDKKELEAAQKELEAIKLAHFCEHCQATMHKTVLPVKSVGVQGDFRTYRFPAVLRFKKDEENGFWLHL